MGKLRHTPGPWTWNGASCVLDNHNNVLVAFVHGQATFDDSERDHADARLTAAAPEMFEALINLCYHFCVMENIENGYDPREGEAKEIIYAIEKATGLPVDEVLS